MTRNISLFCLFCFFALFGVASRFGERILIHDWSVFLFVVVQFCFFAFGVLSVMFSLGYKYVLRYDPEMKNAVNYFIFGFLIWKEFHPKDKN